MIDFSTSLALCIHMSMLGSQLLPFRKDLETKHRHLNTKGLTGLYSYEANIANENNGIPPMYLLKAHKSIAFQQVIV